MAAMVAYSALEHWRRGGEGVEWRGMEHGRGEGRHTAPPSPIQKLTLDGFDILGASHPRWRAMNFRGLAPGPVRRPRGV
jgi:hypothetical protein